MSVCLSVGGACPVHQSHELGNYCVGVGMGGTSSSQRRSDMRAQITTGASAFGMDISRDRNDINALNL